MAQDNTRRGELLKQLLTTIDKSVQAEFAAVFEALAPTPHEPKIPETLDKVPFVKYVPGSKTPVKHLHIGQLKLILSEIQFLNSRSAGLCIYAGAAPSHKGALLASMFPDIKFLLVDPREFSIVPFGTAVEVNLLEYEREVDPSPATCRRILGEVAASDGNLFTACCMFTEAFARAAAELVPAEGLYFISDIRTAAEGDLPFDIDILDNNAQMATWIHIMNPAASLLKFRHPFYESVEKMLEDAKKPGYAERLLIAKTVTGMDFVAAAAEQRVVFPPGAIYIQAFAQKKSTETRVMVTRPRERADWGTPEDYEGRLFVWNSMMRSYIKFHNPDADARMGFDHCADCALAGKICRDWIKPRHELATRLGLKSVRRLVEVLLKWSGATYGRTLKSGEHGNMF